MINYNENVRSEPKKRVSYSSKPICCIECDKVLGQLLILETVNEVQVKYQFKCPCGGESFTTTTNADTRFLTAEGLTVAGSEFLNNKSITTLVAHNA